MLDLHLLDDLPTGPGVYLIRSKSSQIIYVGKAKSLKKRLATYFRPGGDGRMLMPYLQQEAHHVDTIIVKNECEALILENNLIKHHQPKYNVLLKDDKNYLALKLDRLKPWPRLEVLRYRSSSVRAEDLFGPYSSSASKQTQQFIDENFQLRRCSDHELKNRTRPCLLYGMKRCLAPCMNFCTESTYEERVQAACDFLSGNCQKALETIDRKIEEASLSMEFEKAQELHQLRLRLNQRVEPQIVDVLTGAEGELLALQSQPLQDGLWRCALSRVMVRSGKVLDVSTQLFESVEADPLELLPRLALQHVLKLQKESVQIPIIWLDLPQEYLLVLKQSFKELGVSISCKSCKRGASRELLQLAERNGVHRLKQEGFDDPQGYRLLEQVRETLELEKNPLWIECLDTSHTQGDQHVASLVVYMQARAEKSLYRRYKVLSCMGDDYGAMREVLKKRFNKARMEGKWPDLLILDGGRAHLDVANELLQAMDFVGIELIAISKEDGNHTKGLTGECIHRIGERPKRLERNSSVLHFLQRIRDSAHEQAIEYHRKRRTKAVINSELDDIPGIGPKKKGALLKFFGSVGAIRRADDSQLQKVPGLTISDCRRLSEFLGLKLQTLELNRDKESS